MKPFVSPSAWHLELLLVALIAGSTVVTPQHATASIGTPTATSGFACPADTPNVVVYRNLAGFPPLVAPGTINFGGGSLTVTPNANKTAVNWSLSGLSSFGKVDAVVVWGVNSFNGQHDGVANTYRYNPEASNDTGLTDNNPSHQIVHLAFCGDPDGVPPLGVVGGTVWNDSDGDREFLADFLADPSSEPRLQGWAVRLLNGSCTAAGGLVAVPGNPAITSPTGDYSWNVPPGTFCVDLVQPVGWEQTAPSELGPSTNFGFPSVVAELPSSASVAGNRWEITMGSGGAFVGGVSGLNFGVQFSSSRTGLDQRRLPPR